MNSVKNPYVASSSERRKYYIISSVLIFSSQIKLTNFSVKLELKFFHRSIEKKTYSYEILLDSSQYILSKYNYLEFLKIHNKNYLIFKCTLKFVKKSE